MANNDAATPATEASVGSVDIIFLDGETVTVELQASMTVGTLLDKAVEMSSHAGPVSFMLLDSADRILTSNEMASQYAGKCLSAIAGSSKKAYYGPTADLTSMELLDEGHPNWDETESGKFADFATHLAPAPVEWPGCRHLARACEGVTVTASGNMAGNDFNAQQKLLNVLRLGAEHGDPFYLSRKGDVWFIFPEDTPKATLTIDLGREAALVRIGAFSHDDRWISRLCVWTSRVPCEKEDEMEMFGQQAQGARGRDAQKPLFVDKTPTVARYIMMSFSSSHYAGCGSRVGQLSVFGYDGSPDEWPEAVKAAM
eukprot:TRINITY_DN19424_c0_g1_i2.p1 TRINITY_DN19424_c0_g1~~TRINITY_DN19424_c0_g1_i2.p1  ORF type:complete len:313 (+),score=50.53 TRINITY_DN19424_c0_g1_i2:139-1077(+)